MIIKMNMKHLLNLKLVIVIKINANLNKSTKWKNF